MYSFEVWSGYDDNEVRETVRYSRDHRDARKTAEEDARLLSEIARKRTWVIEGEVQ